MANSRKSKTKVCNQTPSNKLIDGNKDVDPPLWHAIAGGMVQIPQVNSHIFYFPQGHAEHSYEPVNFPADYKIPSQIPCTVAAIHYRVDPDTDEVYAKLRLVPLHISQVSFDDDAVAGIHSMSETKNKYQSYTKTLTQSDANNGGGFSCPRYCAETLFPSLDYSGNPPSQYICPTDVHGEMWEFKHVYRGTPKRHLLTTGWSEFVTAKLLVSGDSLVFLRAENGDLHVGIRRSKRRIDIGFNPSSKRKSGSEIGILPGAPYGGLISFSREKDNTLQKNDIGNGLKISDKIMGRGKVKAEDVIEAVTLGVNMQPFDVVYYPRVGTPEFFVKTSLIRATLQTRWCYGMRFKMAIETEDSSRISWFIGTIASVQAADPAWPDSLWRLLQVTWDEPDLLKNTKRVNPWQVEIVSNMPSIPFSPFLPSRKKLKLPQHPTFPIDGQFSMPTFPNYFQTPNIPNFHLPETSPAGMQGARQDHIGLSLSNLHLNQFPLGLFKPNFQQPLDHNATPSMTVTNNPTLQKANFQQPFDHSATISRTVPNNPTLQKENFQQPFDHNSTASITVPNNPTLQKENFQQPFDHNATISITVPNNPTLQKADVSENLACSLSEKAHHARPVQFMLFGQTIRSDMGNENAVKKITSNFSNHLQDLPKQSSGERLECSPKNQCQKANVTDNVPCCEENIRD